jgi:tol-pal system protein YbgF
MNLLLVSAIMACAVVLGATPTTAFAQSVTTFTPPSENLTRLQDRVYELERLVADATDKQERAEMEARRLAVENAALKRALEQARSGQADGPAPSDMASGDDSGPPPAPAPTPVASANADAAWMAASALLQQQKFSEAETALQAYLRDYPNAEKAPEARYWLGRILLARKDFPAAAQSLYTLLTTTPNMPRAADAWVRLGIAFSGMGNRDRACAAFKELPERYPNASAQVRQLAVSEASAAQCK